MNFNRRTGFHMDQLKEVKITATVVNQVSRET